MFKPKIITSVCIFSILIGVTSIIKTQTRTVEKKIAKTGARTMTLEKDLHETQLDYFYLSSPQHLSIKVKKLALVEYMPMDFSRIYLNYSDFNAAKNKITILKNNNEKKTQKK